MILEIKAGLRMLQNLAPCTKGYLTVNNEEDKTKAGAINYGISVKAAKVDRRRFIERFISRARKFRSEAQARIDAGVMIKEDVYFDLSITFNGHTYTRRRTFPRVVRLRNEIVRELHIRRQNKSRRFGVLRMLFESDVKNHHEEEHDADIPELPAVMGVESDAPASNLGIAGLSLHLLQSALMYKFCPAMELWLKSISNLVNPETSPSFKEFLDEGNAVVGDTCNERKFAKRPKRESCARLCSIREDGPFEEKYTNNFDKDSSCDSNNAGMDECENDNFSECDAFDTQ